MTHYSSWYYQRVEQKLDFLLQQMSILMADANSILAKITANNSTLGSIQAAVTSLSAGQTTIAAEIDALKAANPGVDFSALDAAADQQTALVSGLATAIPANTPAAT